VLLLQAGATAAAGPDAAMLPHEREQIEAALGRMIRRLPAGAVGAAGQFADPIALAIALGAWGLRVWTVRQARSLVGVAQLQREVAQAVRAEPPPPAPPAAPRREPDPDDTGPLIDSATANALGPQIGAP